MLHNGKGCSHDAVKDTLHRSSSFGWSWSKEKKEPYRHTAIVLYFDKIPSFTVNFRPGENASKFDAAFSECKSEISIEPIINPYDNTVEYFVLFEEIELDSDEAKNRAWHLIQLILSYDPGQYNLLTKNCRNHVEGVKKHVEKHRKELDDLNFDPDMAQVKNGDIFRYVGAATSAFLAVGGAVVAAAAFASAVFGDKRRDEEDEEEENEEQLHAVA